MWKIRKTKTGSGSTAVQVVERKKGKTLIVKHVGSGKTHEEISNLLARAQSYVFHKDNALRLFPEILDLKDGASPVVAIKNLDLTGHTHRFAYDFLGSAYRYNGFLTLGNGLLRDLSLIRIIEPASKLSSIRLLRKYFTITYSKNFVYEQLAKIRLCKEEAESAAINFAKANLSFDFSLVFYDVTTLYFETFKTDTDETDDNGKITREGLRKCGFSKDGKANQPQILVGLMVSKEGYPVSYEIFTGNKFEGKTLLPLILSFKKRHNAANLTVVADAAMLSKDNLTELKKAGLNYIVAARLSNLSQDLIKKAGDYLAKTAGKYFREETELGFLICDYSELRALKDKSDRNKQLFKARRAISDPSKYLKRSRFVEETTTSTYRLNEDLIKKDEMLDGLKGYYTNLADPESSLIVERYHDLWKIEKVFRMSKSDLLARPIFHHKRESIEAHLLIVFVSLCVAKSLELVSSLSIKKIRELIWDVLDVQLTDKSTGISYSKQTTIISQEIQDILKKISG